MNWLLWLFIGILIGWLVEFLIDYLFWQPRCTSMGAELNNALASTDDLTTRAATAESNFQTINTKYTDLNLKYSELNARWKGMDDQLEGERSKNIALTKNVEVLEGRVDTWGRKIGLLASAGGAIGALGAAFSKDDDAAMRNQIGVIDVALKARAVAETELADLRTRLSTINAELDTAKSGQQQNSGQTQAELSDLQAKLKSHESDIVQLRADLQRTQTTNSQLSTQIGGWRKRLSLLSGAGVLAGLGPILMNDEGDEQRIASRLRDFNSQLESKVGAGKDTEISTIRSRLDALRSEYDVLREQHEALRTQLPSFTVPAAPILASNTHKDPLVDIDGIGPVYEERLNAGGIFTFAQMIDAGSERLRELAAPQQWQSIDTDEWIVQARKLVTK